ncbi:MAG: hypothetical protein BRD29_03650 [Bacteroidetes bacterium QH_2_67_10]|nr:MAG: hypothetical protein BRD29_03650 [Bacteroidetes bacterium QH_2_67_10]
MSGSRRPPRAGIHQHRHGEAQHLEGQPIPEPEEGPRFPAAPAARAASETTARSTSTGFMRTRGFCKESLLTNTFPA